MYVCMYLRKVRGERAKEKKENEAKKSEDRKQEEAR